MERSWLVRVGVGDVGRREVGVGRGYEGWRVEWREGGSGVEVWVEDGARGDGGG